MKMSSIILLAGIREMWARRLSSVATIGIKISSDTDLHKTFTLSIFVSFKELKIECKGNEVLSFPKDCAAGQEACGQLLALTVSGKGFSFSWEVQNTTLAAMLVWDLSMIPLILIVEYTRPLVASTLTLLQLIVCLQFYLHTPIAHSLLTRRIC